MQNRNIKMSVLWVCLLLCVCNCYFSQHWRKCRLERGEVDADALAIEQLPQERVQRYYSSYYIAPQPVPQLPLTYINVDYYYHEYIAAGGSGEVYLIEMSDKPVGKALKRFFKEKPVQFARENFIMKKLNYEVEWSKDCVTPPCNDSQPANTIALYPHKQSTVLRLLDFDPKEAPLVFYKIAKQLLNSHMAGIIHDDLKLGNVLINTEGREKFLQAQLIDWNLATFYYLGYDSNLRKGTACFYAPQLLLRSVHITPAADIWSLAVVMYTFFTDEKPFVYKCKKDTLKAIVSLKGAKAVLDLVDKYHLASFEYISYIEELRRNTVKYQPVNLIDLVPEERKFFFTEQLLNIFERMMEVDPEERITAEELLQLDFFTKLKKLPPMEEDQSQEETVISQVPEK